MGERLDFRESMAARLQAHPGALYKVLDRGFKEKTKKILTISSTAATPGVAISSLVDGITGCRHRATHALICSKAVAAKTRSPRSASRRASCKAGTARTACGPIKPRATADRRRTAPSGSPRASASAGTACRAAGPSSPKTRAASLRTPGSSPRRASTNAPTTRTSSLPKDARAAAAWSRSSRWR
jgi:hypothetical protein